MADGNAIPRPKTADEIELERLKVEVELEKARGDRIKAIGLPSFDGKTSFGAGGGAIESAMLATEALRGAAAVIADAARKLDGVPKPSFLILAGDESVDFSPLAAIGMEAGEFEKAFATIVGSDRQEGPQAVAPPLAGTMAAVGAIAGLLRSETTVSGTDVPFSHRTLANAVAAALPEQAILPSAIFAGIPAQSPENQTSLLARLSALQEKRDRVAAMPDSESKAQQDALVARYDAFRSRIATADPSGAIPMVKAAMLDRMVREPMFLLRVYVEKAGGSLVNRTNLLTWLGILDPVKVSGGLVVSFTIVDPSDGSVKAGDVFASRSRPARIRTVQKSKEVARAFGPGPLLGRNGSGTA